MSDLECTRRPEPAVEKPEPITQPDFYMPAMPPLGLIAAVEHWVRCYRRRRRFRARILPLLKYDDQKLRDMGYERKDILWAARLPLNVDAQRALSESRAHLQRCTKHGRGSASRQGTVAESTSESMC